MNVNQQQPTEMDGKVQLVKFNLKPKLGKNRGNKGKNNKKRNKGNKNKKSSPKPRLRDRLNTKENREKARDIGEEAVDYFDDYDDLIIEKKLKEYNQEKLNSELIKSVKQSDLNKVTEYVNKGADINTKDKHGQTPLHIASKRGYSDIAKFLLDNGADIRAQENKLGQQPLHLAAAKGHLDIVKSLVEKGADVDYYQGGGGYSTPLHFAAKKDHFFIVKYLIENGADPDKKDGDGKTPMERAAEKGLTDIADYLKVRMRHVTETPQTTEEQRVTAESHQVTTEFSQVSTEDYSNTSLRSAAEQGNLNAVKYFVEKGEDINAENAYHETPLYLAALNGHLDVVKYLVDKGARFNRNDNIYYEISALPYAAESGNLELVKYLVEKGVDVNSYDNHGYNSLHTAASKGKFNVIKYLVEKGANVNYTSTRLSHTPLYKAVKNGYLDIAKYLIENGANLRNDGDLVLRQAIKEGDLYFVKYLLENGVDAKYLETAIEERKFDIAIFLINKGADITSKNNLGYTVLHQAVEKGSLDLVKLLVEEKGIDVNVKSKYNNTTSLHLATKTGNFDLLKYLINAGADIHVKDALGNTPLHLAAHEGYSNIVSYLLEKGANPNATDNKGNTPLHLAAQKGYLNIVKALLEKGGNPKASDNEDKTSYQRAAENCHLDIVDLLAEGEERITKGPEDANKELLITEGQSATEESKTACEDDNTSLHLAAKHGELDIIKCLLAKGADINAKDESGFTPLHEAVVYKTIYSSFKVVKYLVENGADINARTESGQRTPLHYAVLHGSTSFSVVNGRVTGGCLSGNFDVIQYLVKKGADVRAEDKNGKTPLDLAKTRCYKDPETKDVIEFLSSYKCGRYIRIRRDLTSNSLTGNSTANRAKALTSSIGAPGLPVTRVSNSHAAVAAHNLNTTVVNNTLILGILAAGLFNKTRFKQPIGENLLSPREQLMRSIDKSSKILELSLLKGKEKGWDIPDIDEDKVKFSDEDEIENLEK